MYTVPEFEVGNVIYCKAWGPPHTFEILYKGNQKYFVRNLQNNTESSLSLNWEWFKIDEKPFPIPYQQVEVKAAGSRLGIVAVWTDDSGKDIVEFVRTGE